MNGQTSLLSVLGIVAGLAAVSFAVVAVFALIRLAWIWIRGHL